MSEVAPRDYFEDMEKQAHAARLGMWVFLGSEVLFFSGLFALYMAYRVEHPYGFGVGVEHNTIVYGSVNTGVLLVSSYTVALAVHMLRGGRHKATQWLLALTHRPGPRLPGHQGSGVREALRRRDLPRRGRPLLPRVPRPRDDDVLHPQLLHDRASRAARLRRSLRAHLSPREGAPAAGDRRAAPHALLVGAVYWHLVDLVWVFLWPLFYLVPGAVK